MNVKYEQLFFIHVIEKIQYNNVNEIILNVYYHEDCYPKKFMLNMV